MSPGAGGSVVAVEPDDGLSVVEAEEDADEDEEGGGFGFLDCAVCLGLLVVAAPEFDGVFCLESPER